MPVGFLDTVPFQSHSLPQGLALLSRQRDRDWVEVQLKGWSCISCGRGYMHPFCITFWERWILKQTNHSEALVISPDESFCCFRYRKKCWKRSEVCLFAGGFKGGCCELGVYLTWSVHSTAHCCSQGSAARGGQESSAPSKLILKSSLDSDKANLASEEIWGWDFSL